MCLFTTLVALDVTQGLAFMVCLSYNGAIIFLRDILICVLFRVLWDRSLGPIELVNQYMSVNYLLNFLIISINPSIKQSINQIVQS